MLGAVDKHVPSACFVEPDGQPTELPKLEELKLEPELYVGAELYVLPEPYDELEPITEPDEKLDDDVDKHDPSACFDDPDGHGATFVEPELKLEPDP